MLGNARRLATATAVVACVSAGVAAPAARAVPHTVRASVSSASAQGSSDSGAGGVAVSGDGRFVAFASDAPDLVAGDTNGVADVFIRNLRTDTTQRVSVSTGGTQGDDASTADALAVSPSGRFVTFTSDATNLAPGNDDSLCAPTPARTCISATAEQERPACWFRSTGYSPADALVLSSGARFYADDSSGQGDVVRCRRSTHRCAIVSVLPPSVIVDEVDANSFVGGISSGGRFVLFLKAGSNEAPNATTLTAGGVFVRDVRQHRTRIVTTHFGDGANGIWPRAGSFSSRAKPASSSPDTNHVENVFVRDLRTGATHRISVSSAKQQANRASIGVAISSGGRYCLFESGATDLVAGDTNGATDLFLRDRVHGRTIRVDVSTAGLQAKPPGALRRAVCRRALGGLRIAR